MMTIAKKVLLSGATGLVGSGLSAALNKRGYVVRSLSRGSGDVIWDVDAGILPEDALDGVDAIIHLAGEPIAQRWTDESKERILNSRVRSTKLLADLAAKQAKPPAMILASGINFYGDHPAGTVDESSESGSGFLAEVCRKWEAAAAPLVAAGGRVVFMRTGVVLDAGGGALAKMLPPFRLGLGGRIGSGSQRMSWVSLPDLIAAYCFALEHDSISGPVNAVAPEPVTNSEFTQILGDVLGRPTIVPVPTFAVKALFGEMGEATVLGDLAVSPKRLLEGHFTWKFATLETALSATLGKAKRE